MRRYGPHGFSSVIRAYWRLQWHCFWGILKLKPCCVWRKELISFRCVWLDIIACTCGRVFWTMEHGANPKVVDGLHIQVPSGVISKRGA